jgi:AcrR family transcriptional regulator
MDQSDNAPVRKNDEIIQAAREVFAAYGIKKATMDDVALKLGISRSSLY